MLGPSSINPLRALNLSHCEGLVAVAVLVVVHVAGAFIGGSCFVEFGPAASALRALRNLAEAFAVCALLDEFGLVACL